MSALRARPSMSTSELLTATGMSRPTVHAAAQHLVDLGWVTETTGQSPQATVGGTTGRATGRGRPARTFSFSAAAGHVLGVDIGAHTARVALADLRGETVAQSVTTFADPDIAADERLRRVRESAAGAVREAGLRPSQVLAVCVGTSGTVSADGVVRRRTGIPGFLGVDLRGAFAEDFGGVRGGAGGSAQPERARDGDHSADHLIVENDCNLAALAERWQGLAAGADDVVCLLAGERLGVGMFAGGTLLRGHHNGARNLGFLGLMAGGLSPEGGIASEARAAGAELVAELARRRRTPRSRTHGAVLYGIVDGDPERVDAESVFRAIRENDAAATRILDRALAPAAHAVATLAMLLDPERVVISGAVAAAGDILLDPLRERLAALTPDPPQLAASPLRDRAVVTGAVRLALDTAEKHFLDALVRVPQP